MDDIRDELHALEHEFGLPAWEILDTINRRNRCKIAVRGAIAEAHLIRHLRRLEEAGYIQGFEDFDRDAYPDCRVDYDGRSFFVECKNVQKQKRQRGETEPVTIDFKRTRNPMANPEARYYGPEEFEIVAACLWNRTRQWVFRFAVTADLPRHPQYPDRILDIVTVDVAESPIWTANLAILLSRLAQERPTQAPVE